VFKTDHYLETYTGKKLYILDPQPEAICIEDIAHSLARTVRYRGHIKDGVWYCVGEHSIHVANVAASHKGPYKKTRAQVMRAFMHDAVEAYMGDIPSPIKASIPELRAAERDIEHVIMAKYGLQLHKPDWLDAIDKRIIVDERRAVMSPTDNVWLIDNLNPLGVDIQCWDIEEAEHRFLQMFHDLSIRKQIERRVHNA
jgi:5'-deoxynucleotidase YfbR-like HD superfamily hydrolase